MQCYTSEKGTIVKCLDVGQKKGWKVFVSLLTLIVAIRLCSYGVPHLSCKSFWMKEKTDTLMQVCLRSVEVLITFLIANHQWSYVITKLHIVIDMHGYRITINLSTTPVNGLVFTVY